MGDDEWEDIEVWDLAAILNCAIELVNEAELAKEAGDFKNCSLYISKALDMMNDAEIEYPDSVAQLRETLEAV